MGKYSKEELIHIAKDALMARDVGDMWYHIGVHILCDVFNISEEVCHKRIEQLAKTGEYDD